MKVSVKSVLTTLRSDKRYKRLLESFDTSPAFRIPKESLAEEIKVIHELREIRRLNTNDAAFVDKVIKANTHDQAQRSRLVEIIVVCTRISNKLTEAIEALKQHYMLEYVDHLRQFRTKEERNLVLNMALRKFIRFVNEVESLKEMANIVVLDIDKAAWSLKNTIEALKISSAREVNI